MRKTGCTLHSRQKIPTVNVIKQFPGKQLLLSLPWVRSETTNFFINVPWSSLARVRGGWGMVQRSIWLGAPRDRGAGRGAVGKKPTCGPEDPPHCFWGTNPEIFNLIRKTKFPLGDEVFTTPALDRQIPFCGSKSKMQMRCLLLPSLYLGPWALLPKCSD